MVADGTTQPDNSQQQSFVWPPAAYEQSGAVIEAKPIPLDRPRRVDLPKPTPPRLLEKVESALLGTRARLLTGRDSRWVPEPADFACPSCGRGVGEGEVSPEDGRCSSCRPEKLAWDRFIRLGDFAGELRDAVHATKYEAWRAQGTQLGRVLGYRVLDELRAAGIPPEAAILVPVPMPTLRRLGRGIDHSMVLARGVRATSGVRLVPMLRRSGGKPQVEVAPSLRAASLRNKVRLRQVSIGCPQAVVLVDDVKTTGATLRACSRAIRGVLGESKAEIWASVVAVTAERNRSARREISAEA
ncbi:MAG: ComF family protein [Phycisphaera sp.]|nr:MAG: ComF family protein [Phycisphaera sp.]